LALFCSASASAFFFDLDASLSPPSVLPNEKLDTGALLVSPPSDEGKEKPLEEESPPSDGSKEKPLDEEADEEADVESLLPLLSFSYLALEGRGSMHAEHSEALALFSVSQERHL